MLHFPIIEIGESVRAIPGLHINRSTRTFDEFMLGFHSELSSGPPRGSKETIVLSS
jgi:hypothetical protein